ncbi:type IV toxin-antitoxin system AbiEi family antitoxin domain-containing protein [Paractinoplanes globisporus]|uniref:Type IV toxin-antitoxin system AbiEi family antitoxin domain-containing protein n=1 Tax=Paractinoplanes globisporus TaxID=113565 RepID=A0ABW6WGU0_9ACTN|nr:type IV toxin-antitoxin system AbiEi family antitoxin domain-containing protein [Actinoplanes globisporus]
MADDLDHLPETFTYRGAREAGVPKRRFYALRDSGAIDQISRGVYRRTGASRIVDLDRLEIALRAPLATLCLTTALAYHDLTDANPASIDVAVPAGAHRPQTTAPVTWHQFDRATFDLGRTELPVDDTVTIGLYSAVRSVVDAFRLRHREGEDLAYIALRRWLRRPGNSPATLHEMARNFPRAVKPITKALEILQYD